MKRIAEIGVFGVLAIGLHMAFMMELPAEGDQSSGSGGDALISLAAASAQIETMVESWTAPPKVQPDFDPPQLDTAAPAPVLPMASVRMDDAPNAELKMTAMKAPSAPNLVDIDTQSAPPPPKKAEVTKPSPQKPKTALSKPRKKAQTANKSQKASAGRAAQKAAGTGGGAVAGKKGTAKTVSAGKRKSLIASWGARIRAQVERRKRSPAGRSKGTVVLRLQVSRTGQLRAVSVRKSSGNAALDSAAVAAVKRAGKFPAAPKQLTDSSYSFSLPIRFGR
jgi:protein TonB